MKKYFLFINYNIYILLFIFIFLILTGCNKRINKAISINYQILKEDTCQYFCYEEVIAVVNNSNDSLYFYKPWYEEKNKFGLYIPYFWAPSEKEGNYNKYYEKDSWDKTSVDYYNDSNKIFKKYSNVFEKSRVNEKKRFNDSIMPLYFNEYKFLNNLSLLDKNDSNCITDTYRSVFSDIVLLMF